MVQNGVENSQNEDCSKLDLFRKAGLIWFGFYKILGIDLGHHNQQQIYSQRRPFSLEEYDKATYDFVYPKNLPTMTKFYFLSSYLPKKMRNIIQVEFDTQYMQFDAISTLEPWNPAPKGMTPEYFFCIVAAFWLYKS